MDSPESIRALAQLSKKLRVPGDAHQVLGKFQHSQSLNKPVVNAIARLRRIYRTDDALKASLPHLLGRVLTGPEMSVEEFQEKIQRMLETVQSDEKAQRATSNSLEQHKDNPNNAGRGDLNTIFGEQDSSPRDEFVLLSPQPNNFLLSRANLRLDSVFPDDENLVEFCRTRLALAPVQNFAANFM